MFVANRVKRIAETTHLMDNTWKYCPSDLNQADLRNRGATIARMENGDWFAVPDWLLDESQGSQGQTARNTQIKRVRLSKRQFIAHKCAIQVG